MSCEEETAARIFRLLLRPELEEEAIRVFSSSAGGLSRELLLVSELLHLLLGLIGLVSLGSGTILAAVLVGLEIHRDGLVSSSSCSTLQRLVGQIGIVSRSSNIR